MTGMGSEPYCPICGFPKTEVGGALVICTTCGKSKAPLGRSSPGACYYCDFRCPGYREEPYPDELFPGEVRAEFCDRKHCPISKRGLK